MEEKPDWRKRYSIKDQKIIEEMSKKTREALERHDKMKKEKEDRQKEEK